jgi:hypothetical protein
MRRWSMDFKGIEARRSSRYQEIYPCNLLKAFLVKIPVCATPESGCMVEDEREDEFLA